ncbi:hypothetical protein ACKI1I_46000 [Streptomyces turgidiscabies]|uniref:Uncharacterized protein n=1 Tax=Streptomyces turgidiscabies (strain Car8) TaxID=698760 RepID=L7FHF3_STRT8|nr:MULTISPECIES: hypothetical protein [Streptomyces]ELP70501.1 hypothetical protein STRTUCAR8_09738 [Streptomyces turgidiscabies Car8]MDX3499565.1 hypothetical protein [Streptomyces turgidiscabies]GAQ76486.1 hypothetical protein T45_08281 [Streptomyces turgidiscabies]
MIRYVHYEVMCGILAVCAAAVSAGVVFGSEGAPEAPRGVAPAIALGLLALACAAGFGVLTVSRLKWFGEGRDFEKAVPLEKTGVVLPAPGRQYRDSVNVWLFLGLVASALGGGLLWGRALALWPLLFAAVWLARGRQVARWERCHGLVLWIGRVHTRLPEGDNQNLYSSVR